MKIQLENLQNNGAENENSNKEIEELKNKIKEQDKVLKKSEEKYTSEISELKRKQMMSSDNLRSAIQERDMLRENDRILLNTFDMMKKYMDQMQRRVGRFR